MCTLSFFGAAGTVTGSSMLLEARGVRVLVDCGLFQGNRSVRDLNAQPFPFDPTSVDLVLLTHAHTDHAGLVPKLIRDGYSGPFFCTQATADLLSFMLLDSARIQEADQLRENRRLERKGKQPRPVHYTAEHAEAALRRIERLGYGTWRELAPGFDVRLWNAGHILGSASIETRHADAATGHTMRILFSGDLGPDEKVFHPEPDAEDGYDYVICESTYGDRDREDYTLQGRRRALRHELTDALARGGNVVIPCFAVERTQELLHDIGVLLAHDEIPPAQVFLDSPLAGRVTDVFTRHADALEDLEIPSETPFRHPNFSITQSVDESRAINRIRGGAIIISASGMADAGRVVHHLKNNIHRKEATILFVGYQALGTTGHHILSGARAVFLHGKEYRIRARIRALGTYSAHADQGELLSWIAARRPIAGGLFLNHGEDPARQKLRALLVENGMPSSSIFLPGLDEAFALKAGSPLSKGRAEARINKGALTHDWHDGFEALVLDLEEALEKAPDAETQARLLARLRRSLEQPDPV